MYFWLEGYKSGKPYILGPYMSEDEAHSHTSEFDGWYEVHELRTRDSAVASRMIKAKRLERGMPWDQVVQRTRHGSGE